MSAYFELKLAFLYSSFVSFSSVCHKMLILFKLFGVFMYIVAKQDEFGQKEINLGAKRLELVLRFTEKRVLEEQNQVTR